MSLFKSIKKESTLNENLQTAIYNVLTRPIIGKTHLGNIKMGGNIAFSIAYSYGFVAFLSILGLNGSLLLVLLLLKTVVDFKFSLIDFFDRSLFDSSFKITPELEFKLIKMIKSESSKYRSWEPLKLSFHDSAHIPEDRLSEAKDRIAKYVTHLGMTQPNLTNFKDTIGKSVTYHLLKYKYEIYIVILEFDTDDIYKVSTIFFPKNIAKEADKHIVMIDKNLSAYQPVELKDFKKKIKREEYML